MRGKADAIETPSVTRLPIGSVALSWLAVAVLGGVEGVFGRTRYLEDSISYLDVSRAIPALNWPEIFNPMWSPGYPLLVAIARGFAPPTLEGEWYAITLLNLVIFLGAYAAWRLLICSAIAFYRPASAEMADQPIAVWTTCWLFLGCGLGLQNVSIMSPDLLVAACFILAAALTLDLIRRGMLRDAAVLGLVLGAGVWVKSVFIAFAAIFFLVVFIACCAKRTRWRPFCVAAAIYLPILACYVASISWSYGQLTFGASGALNYAFHVNHLPAWFHWRGGPPQFGTPVHPTRQLLPGLPVFEFATPFRTTYPPYGNLAYWYQGFHQIYSLKLQIEAIGRSTWYLAALSRGHPILIGVALALLISVLKREWRRAVWGAAKSCWPLSLPALLGMGTFLAVHVEERYIGAFVLIFGLLSLAPLLEPRLAARRPLALALMLIMATAAVAELALNNGAAYGRALRLADFHDDPQWRLAAALSAHGLKAGDPVAVVQGYVARARFHWAYAARLRIIAEFGSLPWHLVPQDRTRFDSHPIEPADQDYGRLFWELTPPQRAAVIEAFRSTGARAIVSVSSARFSSTDQAVTKLPDKPERGWLPLGNTGAWIYDFPR
jgi:hypothetical protein